MLEHELDIQADFLRFYGISKMQALELDGPEFLGLAQRLFYYEGVLQTKLRVELEESKKRNPTQRAMERAQRSSKHGESVREVPLSSMSEFIDMD